MVKVVVVGEAWGRREAEFQHPLVGPTGRELSLMFGQTNFAPYMLVPCKKCKADVQFTGKLCPRCHDHIWPNEFTLIEHWKRLRHFHDIQVTNVFNLQPLNNELGTLFGYEAATPMPSWKASQKVGGSHLLPEYFHHVKRLWKEVQDAKPNLVLALGNAACWALLGQTKITSLRGTVAWSQYTDTKVLPSFHPASVLRNPAQRPTVLSDFTKAGREREFAEVRRPERWITVPSPDEAGIKECYDWFDLPAVAYANDIETKKRQITIVGFARSRDQILVIPIRYEDGTSFWPTPELEFAAWKAIIHGLEKPQPKIFQNGLYDLSYYIRMGIHPKNVRHDTMLWHHSQYPELPKSLGYLGSIYANDVAWKMMRRNETLKRDE